MADEFDEGPGEPTAEAGEVGPAEEPAEIFARIHSEGRLRLAASAGSVWERGISLIRPRARTIGFGVLGLCVLVIGALALAQGLTAALRSSWPVRVAGISDTGEGRVGLSVETNLALADKSGQWPTHTEPVTEQKVADIHDFAQASGQSNGVRVVPDKRAPSRDYLPPDMRSQNAPTSNVLITVPVSQGRLLRFDEPVESVFIADPTVADIRVVSPDLVYVYGKHAGRTNLMAVSNRPGGADGGPKLTGSALLNVVWDEASANDAKQALNPNTPADIYIFGHRAAVKGTARNIDQAVGLADVAQTYTPPGQPPINASTLEGSNQINIRVRFAEVSRQDLRSFGIDWNATVNAGSFSFGLTRSGGTQDHNLELAAGAGNFNIDLLIEALQARGALTVLAEPNLTAVTGQTASFLAGGEVPIPVPASGNSGGNNVPIVTIEYKTFGVSLSFTPTIIKENRIALRVKPEVSSIDDTKEFSFQGFKVPAFTVRRAETVVEVGSGQTFAIGGLFQRDVSRSVDKLPVLGDVPVLGPLFRSERYQRNETELVILITPYLVNPVSDRHLATPLDRMDMTPAWRADVMGPDATSKGAALTSQEAEKTSGFILK